MLFHNLFCFQSKSSNKVHAFPFVKLISLLIHNVKGLYKLLSLFRYQISRFREMILTRNYSSFKSFVFLHNSLTRERYVLFWQFFSHVLFQDTQSKNQFETHQDIFE